jgi:putative MFS transporter
VQFLVVPVVALLSWQLVPISWQGLDGWRWVVLIGAVGAIVVWFLRLGVPESPRWLLQRGRIAEAEAVTARIEARVAADLGQPLPPPAEQASNSASEGDKNGSFSEIWQPAYRTRTIMLMVFQLFQSVGFYGFASWVPTLLEQKGITISHSLEYSFLIAIANPFGPLLMFGFADKLDRKWLIVLAALSTAVFGLLFGTLGNMALIICAGVMVTLSNNVMSVGFHAYQSELFPTRIRARAIGFTYSFSRISTVFVSFVIAFILQTGGVPAVFAFIAFAMLMVMLSIGLFGPRTKGRALETIST